MLYKHQKEFLENDPPNRSLLCWDTGTGKTITALCWAKLKGGNNLVICPKGLRENWARNANKLQINCHIISKEQFRSNAHRLPKFDNVIVDEAHFFSGQKSQLSKLLRAYIKTHNINRILLLTATPYLSTPWNIYVLAAILGHHWNYIEFKNMFFYDIKMGNRIIPKIRSNIEKSIASLVQRISSIVKLDDCIDVPKQSFEEKYVELTQEQIDAKKELIDTQPIVLFTKIHQIENGTLKSDGYDPDKSFPNNKSEIIYNLCAENDKIAIVCRYNLQIEQLKMALLELKKPIFVINGLVKDKDKVVLEAEKAKKAIVLINASCSEGYELPSIGVIIFASLSFSFKDYKQMTGRFLRINNPKKNVFIHLIVSGGFDEDVYKSISKKQDFSIEIYARKKFPGSFQ